MLTLVQGTVNDTLAAVGQGAVIPIRPEVVVIALAALGVLILARVAAAIANSRGEREVALEGGAAH